jgi:catechol 2,3-dioxygenase-like lactoylglutathione lyase family enzyme
MIEPVRYRHVAIYVDDLRAAEDFYAQVFAAEVLFRETVDSAGVWRTLPLGSRWEHAEAAGIEIDMSVLQRDEVVLPLFVGRPSTRIIGLHASVDEIDAMRRRMPPGARVIAESEHDLAFADSFEVEWQVSVPGQFRSSGEIRGEWLAL